MGIHVPGSLFLLLPAASLTEGNNHINARLLIVHGEGRKMRWILMEEDVSIWKLLFIMGFLALLIFVLVQTAPSVEVQYGETLFNPSLGVGSGTESGSSLK